MRAWGLLWAAKWAVAQFGWARAVREWERVYPQPASEMLANTEKLEAIDLVVRKTAARSLLSVECKERALACLALARMNGISAQLVVGVTHYPLQGHVWVEAANRVISDMRNTVNSSSLWRATDRQSIGISLTPRKWRAPREC